jgi:3-methylornithine--L-lysine ligase
MLAAVAGGRLQGVEASYLAHKAGWDVLLLDRSAQAPASRICDVFIQMDVTEGEGFREAIRGVDLIIPALEDDEALHALAREAMRSGVPIALDLDAYRISSSKVRSNRLFAEIGVPVPRSWPECGFPVVAKPSDASGSEGVQVFSSEKEMGRTRKTGLSRGSWVLQEFVEGPSFSLEVLGAAGGYFPLQVTDLHMDAGYDCKRVTAPTVLSPELSGSFQRISTDIARALDLNGIMDVEVVLASGELKVLEIDVRLPSQTPTTVFWSTGLNMVEMLGSIFEPRDFRMPEVAEAAGVVYQHIAVSPGTLEILGEHVMAGSGPLHVVEDFFGADEAITSYTENRDRWAATLITRDRDLSGAEEKMKSVMAAISKRFRIQRVLDSLPDRV